MQLTRKEPGGEHPLTVMCAACGHAFAPAGLYPRLRCPHCVTLGYPDRSGRYLLPLRWECGVCGAQNEGMFNFCIDCGTGLASRCLRCGGPVYGAVCHTCGTHQARLRHFQEATATRERTPPVRPDLTQPFQPIRPTSTSMAAGRAKRLVGAAAAATGGLVLIVSRRAWLPLLAPAQPVLAGVATQASTALNRAFGAINPIYQAGRTWLVNWWQAFQASMQHPPSSTDPEYAYLFATIVFEIALLPVLIFLLGRLIRRLFP